MSSIRSRLAKIEQQLRSGTKGNQEALRWSIEREYREMIFSYPEIVEYFRLRSAGDDAELCDIPREDSNPSEDTMGLVEELISTGGTLPGEKLP